jgi:uncharacterized protein YcaQ
MDGEVVARVDLEANRQASVLRVHVRTSSRERLTGRRSVS